MESTNLLGIRQRFITYSGRADLASTSSVTNDTDEGADFFIQAGQDYLESILGTENSLLYLDYTTAAGDVTINLEYASGAESIVSPDKLYKMAKASDSDYEVASMTYRSLDYLLYNYPDWDDTTQDEPVDWGWEMEQGEDKIRIMPPADDVYTIRVYGKAFPDVLTDNTDTNVWTNKYPQILIAAALHQLYSFYGQDDDAVAKQNFIVHWMNQIDKKQVERELQAAKEKVR